GADSTDAADFTNCRIKFSYDKDDFSNAMTIPSTFGASRYWYNPLNSNIWPSGSTVYFRLYVNDGHHADDVEFPRNESLFYFKLYYSFYVQ
ncbi:MAG: hypothetical protein ABI772_15140, partial [Bacteroidota bacterium]